MDGGHESDLYESAKDKSLARLKRGGQVGWITSELHGADKGGSRVGGGRRLGRSLHLSYKFLELLGVQIGYRPVCHARLCPGQ